MSYGHGSDVCVLAEIVSHVKGVCVFGCGSLRYVGIGCGSAVVRREWECAWGCT